MVYIESHQQLATHPKTKKATRLLGVSRPAVIGHLHCFWYWAMDHAKDGDITTYAADVIADGAMWDGDPDKFITALVDCAVKADGHGFLERRQDGRLLIHDWHQYGGKLVDKRESDAERKRREREEEKQRQAEEEAVRQAEAKQTSGTPARAPAGRKPPKTATEDKPAQPSGTDLPGRLPEDGAECPQDSGGTSAMIDGTSAPLFLRPPDVQRTAQVDNNNKDNNKQTDLRQQDLRQTEQSEDNNNTEERTGEETGGDAPPGSPPASSDPQCREVVVALLRSLGVSEVAADELSRRRTCEQIQRQAEWLPYRVTEKAGTPKPIRDPAATLVKSIEDGWAVPASYSQARQAKAEKERSAQRALSRAEAEKAERAEAEKAERAVAQAGATALEEAWGRLAEDEQADVMQEAEARALAVAFIADLARKHPNDWRTRTAAESRLLELRNALMAERGLLPPAEAAP